MPTTATAPSEYLAAINSVVEYIIPNPGYLVISGKTRREYIQRQTTNDIDLLATGRALPTLLTAPTGRILEYYTLMEDGDSIIMLTQPGHGFGNAAYFQKRIFFNDKVTIQDQSSDWALIELLGPKAPDLLKKFEISVPSLNEVLKVEWRGARLRVLGQLSFGDYPRFRFVLPQKLTVDFIAELGEIPPFSFAAREVLRIESGHAGDPEFAADATPFELGLDHLVSTTKGCYTGQEVLARQVTYDKVVRRLVQLRSSELLDPGTNLEAEGKPVGQLTSFAVSPRLGPVALAIVRKPFDATGTELKAKVANKQIKAVVA